ncbi:MAG: hypothetical protein CVU55_04955 [Deltaproteobacteria bacterium HGW-Deltaproteobacteria-13]|jgi:hypothetical protein|nr:MAG: hypothetical protein CVU55_04955 [Deltaproteobacteria bacterium HGW-Deltaproteobacteria-13]
MKDCTPVETLSNSVPSRVNPAPDESGASFGKEDKRQGSGRNILCSELLTFRSVLEKIACVNHGNSSWTWDHETRSFLLQAPNDIIEQYVNILTREMGKSLCLHLQRAAIIVDLRPWKTNKDKTSLRIGFEGNHVPIDLRGYTGLDDLAGLHFISTANDYPDLKAALAKVRRMCAKTDAIFENKCDWMWETHWKADGLAFAVVRLFTWESKSSLMKREIERFNNSPKSQQAGLRINLTTYNRGTSFNVRLALEGWPGNLLKYTGILDAFDTHFSGPAD